jgi:hypothetical protein
MVDPSGNGAIAAVYGGVVGSLTGVSGGLAQGGDWKEITVAALAGGAVGIIVGAIDPTEVGAILAINASVGAAGDFSGQIVVNLLKGKNGLQNISMTSIAGSAIGSSAGGWMGSVATKSFLNAGFTKALSYAASAIGMVPTALGGNITKELCK